jgi:hypothetical protein
MKRHRCVTLKMASSAPHFNCYIAIQLCSPNCNAWLREGWKRKSFFIGICRFAKKDCSKKPDRMPLMRSCGRGHAQNLLLELDIVSKCAYQFKIAETMLCLATVNCKRIGVVGKASLHRAFQKKLFKRIPT